MINAGIDVGNGYVKALVKNPDMDKKAQAVDIPSATSTISSREAKIEAKDEIKIKNFFNDIYNLMEVSFESPMITETDHAYIGLRAVRSANPTEEFNLREGHRSKSETELSAKLMLSVLAGKALSDYWAKNKKLPEAGEEISVKVQLAFSLPISEYVEKRDTAIQNYTSSPHVVYIHNFDRVVTVKVDVVSARVMPEGASAQFAIAAKGEKFIEAMIKDMYSNGLSLPEGITAADIASAQGIIGIDIGEGTVNFPIYQDLMFNADTSQTLNKGYGHVLDSAVANLESKGQPYHNRKQLADALENAKVKPLLRARARPAFEAVNDEIGIFVKDVAKKCRDVLNIAGGLAEVIYVYGGGATPVKDKLYPALIDAVKTVFGEDGASFPILYLDSRYSRWLNRDGLYLLCDDGPRSAEDLTNV